MVRRRLPSRRSGRFLHFHPDRFGLRRRDLPMWPRLALIANLDATVLPLAYSYLGLPWRVVAGPLQLKIAILIAHHPIIGNAPLGLQAKHLFQLPCRRRPAMIILRLGWLPREPLVVIGEIVLLHKLVGGLMRADLLPPHFLDQPLLVRPIATLHSSLGLRRVRRDDPYVQFLAHTPKLRYRRLPVQQFLFGGLAHVHVFPI